MRKTIINPPIENILSPDLNFLDLERLAQVEFTSECLEHPVESALLLTEDSGQAFLPDALRVNANPFQTDLSGTGWQAASVGEQIIRVVFDQPRTIEHIFLVFDETQQSRTQEFVLLWLMDKEVSYREILRQQYHFSPPNTTREIEHYEVSLNQLKALELRIMPDINGAKVFAKLKRLRLA
ncbi:MAG: carbohydrate-binding protein [Methylobacter sp.]